MIELNGENFVIHMPANKAYGDVERLYWEMGPWLTKHGGQLNVRGGNLLFGTCPLESQPLFVLRFTR